MRVRLTSTGVELDSELEKYADIKASAIVRHVPHKLRATADCWMHFSQIKKKSAVHTSCTITFRVRDTEFKAEEATAHMYTAIDIAAVHISQQIDDFIARTHKHRVRTRLKRTFRPES